MSSLIASNKGKLCSQNVILRGLQSMARCQYGKVIAFLVTRAVQDLTWEIRLPRADHSLLPFECVMSPTGSCFGVSRGELMVVNLYCQFDWVYNHLGNWWGATLGTYVKALLDGINWRERNPPWIWPVPAHQLRTKGEKWLSTVNPFSLLPWLSPLRHALLTMMLCPSAWAKVTLDQAL